MNSNLNFYWCTVKKLMLPIIFFVAFSHVNFVEANSCKIIFSELIKLSKTTHRNFKNTFDKIKMQLSINPYRSLSLDEVHSQFTANDRLELKAIFGNKMPDADPNLSIEKALTLPIEYRADITLRLMDHLILADRLKQIPENRAFINWFEKNQESLLSRDRVQLLLDRNYTLGDTLREFYAVYILKKSGGEPKFLESTFRKTIKHPLLQTIVAPLFRLSDKTLSSMKSMLVGALIAGPIAGLLNNYLAGPVGPLHSYANQRGQKDLSPLTRYIQSTLSELDSSKKSAEDVAKTMENFLGEMNRYEFNGLTPDEAFELWKTVEKRFRLNTLEMAKATPGDVREGRGLERDFQINIPRSYIQDITSMNSNYEIHSMRLDEMKKELASNPESDKTSLESKILYHKNFMDQAARNIALILAAWTIYDFTYIEYTRNYKVGEIERNLAYETIKKSFKFDLYLDNVKEMANEMLEGMGYPIQVENFARGFVTLAEPTITTEETSENTASSP